MSTVHHEAIVEALPVTSIKDRYYHIQSFSAKNGTGIEEGLQWVVKSSAK